MDKYVATSNLAFPSMRSSSAKADNGNAMPYLNLVYLAHVIKSIHEVTLPSLRLRIVNISKYDQEAWKGLKMTTFKVKFVYSDTG